MSTDALFDAIKKIGGKIDADEPISPKSLSKEDVDLLYTMAYGLYQGGDYVQSRQLFRQLVVCKPLEQKHWVGLGSTLQMEKSYEEALTAWSMAALLEKDDPTPHYHAAECLFSLEQSSEALKALREVKKRSADAEPELMKKVEALEKIWDTQLNPHI
jgi:type III secretion system low calcium response chaperone LcrH/SycD